MLYMSNVTVLTYHYLPENTAGSERVASLVNYLTQCEGDEISLVTLDNYQSSCNYKSQNKKLRVFRLSSIKYSKKKFINRALGEFINSLKIVWYSRRFSAEKVLVSVPSMFLMLLAPIFLNGKILILDIRDLVWDYLPDNSLPLRLSKSILLRLIGNSLKSYDLVLVTNSIQAMRLKFINPEICGRLKVVENGISRCRFKGLDRTRKIIQKRSLKVRRPCRVSSIGNVGMSLHIETLIQTAEVLSTDDFEFYIVGDGTQLDKAKKLIREKGLQNIHLIGQLDWNELGKYYSQSDFLYLQVHPDYDSSRPVRLYEYLATGLPVILAVNGEAREFALQFENVYNVEPCCKNRLRDLLIQLSGGTPIRFCLENVQKIGSEFTREDQLKLQFKDALKVLNEQQLPSVENEGHQSLSSSNV